MDVQGPGAANAVATVKDASKPISGKQLLVQRSVKVAGEPMTKERLIAVIRGKSGDMSASTAAHIFQCLDGLDLATRATATHFQYGVTLEESGFNPLMSFHANAAWSPPCSRLVDLLGDEEFVAHKLRLNAIGANFFRPAEAVDPTKRTNGIEVKYIDLMGKEAALGKAIAATRDTVSALIG